MLKGHVQIDLHNHNTGSKERIEKDNLVTKALERVINTFIGANGAANNALMPIATRALGGLMMFDDDLTEETTNIYFPSEAHLVGFAGQTQELENPYSGSLNVAESGPVANGYKCVWDFSTSQANGTIKSLARTLADQGNSNRCVPLMNCGIGTFHQIRSGTGDANVNGYVAIAYDRTNQYIYFIGNMTSVRSEAGYIQTYTVYKEYLPIHKYAVGDLANTYGVPEAVATFEITRADNTDVRYHFYPAYDGYCYLVKADGNSSGDGTLHVWKLKVSDLSFAISGPQTITCGECQLRGDWGCGCVANGKALIQSYSRRYVYMVNLSNTADIQLVDLGENHCVYSGCGLYTWRNDIVKLVDDFTEIDTGFHQYSNAIIYPDGRIFRDRYHYRNTYYSDSGWNLHYKQFQNPDLVYWGNSYSYRSRGYLLNNYLGTICNLSEAITKTAASSMKVSYTLTDIG